MEHSTTLPYLFLLHLPNPSCPTTNESLSFTLPRPVNPNPPYPFFFSNVKDRLEEQQQRSTSQIFLNIPTNPSKPSNNLDHYSRSLSESLPSKNSATTSSSFATKSGLRKVMVVDKLIQLGWDSERKNFRFLIGSLGFHSTQKMLFIQHRFFY